MLTMDFFFACSQRKLNCVCAYTQLVLNWKCSPMAFFVPFYWISSPVYIFYVFRYDFCTCVCVISLLDPVERKRRKNKFQRSLFSLHSFIRLVWQVRIGWHAYWTKIVCFSIPLHWAMESIWLGKSTIVIVFEQFFFFGYQMPAC